MRNVYFTCPKFGPTKSRGHFIAGELACQDLKFPTSLPAND